MESQSCPFCSGRCSEHWNTFEFLRCRKCGLVFRRQFLSDAELDELYRTSWQAPEANAAETGGTDRRLADAYAEQILKDLEVSDLNGVRVLDYGAGRGELARALGDFGAKVYAVEPYGNDDLRRRTRHVWPSLDAIPNEVRFDGIISVDVIEHLKQPWVDLSLLNHRLVEGGWLIVATANPGGLNARVHRSRWREARKTGHLLFLGHKTLQGVLQFAGFSNVRRLTWPIRYAPRGPRALIEVALRSLGLDGEVRYLARRSS